MLCFTSVVFLLFGLPLIFFYLCLVILLSGSSTPIVNFVFIELCKQNLRHTSISFIQNALSLPYVHLQRNDQ
jgi:hypothetical protein